MCIRDSLETVPGVVAVHELHLWRLNQQKAIASAHVVVESLEDFMRLGKTINSCFHAYGIHSATIQPEIISSITINDQGSTEPVGMVQRKGAADAICQISCRASDCEELTCCD